MLCANKAVANWLGILQILLYSFCLAWRHACSCDQLVHRSIPDSLDGAKLSEQGAFTFGTNSRDTVKSRSEGFPPMHSGIISYGKAMCLISEALEKLKTGGSPRQNNGLLPPGNKNLFVLFS